jgi:hypothetical protein
MPIDKQKQTKTVFLQLNRPSTSGRFTLHTLQALHFTLYTKYPSQPQLTRSFWRWK